MSMEFDESAQVVKNFAEKAASGEVTAYQQLQDALGERAVFGALADIIYSAGEPAPWDDNIIRLRARAGKWSVMATAEAKDSRGTITVARSRHPFHVLSRQRDSLVLSTSADEENTRLSVVSQRGREWNSYLTETVSPKYKHARQNILAGITLENIDEYDLERVSEFARTGSDEEREITGAMRVASLVLGSFTETLTDLTAAQK